MGTILFVFVTERKKTNSKSICKVSDTEYTLLSQLFKLSLMLMYMLDIIYRIKWKKEDWCVLDWTVGQGDWRSDVMC